MRGEAGRGGDKRPGRGATRDAPLKPSSGTHGFAPVAVAHVYVPFPCFCFASLNDPSNESPLG